MSNQGFFCLKEFGNQGRRKVKRCSDDMLYFLKISVVLRVNLFHKNQVKNIIVQPPRHSREAGILKRYTGIGIKIPRQAEDDDRL